MAIIASFLAYPLSAFSDRPQGGQDPFVMSDNDLANAYMVEIDDDDGVIAGDIAVNEVGDDPNQIGYVSDSDGNLISVDVIYLEWTATYTGTNGQVIEVWRFELDNGLRMFAMSEIPEEGVTYTTSNKDQDATGGDPGDIPQIPCFTRGTCIAAPGGPVRIEDLKVGDRIVTADSSSGVILWHGCRRFAPPALAVNPKLAPVRIAKGALGGGRPTATLKVSRQHRMLVSSRVAERMFGTADVLIPAIKLTGLPGIDVVPAPKGIEYHHLLLQDHGVIFAEGAPTESLFAGPGALSGLSVEARQEILTIFPQLADQGAAPKSARPIPPQRRQNRLVERMLRNRRQVLEAFDPAALPLASAATSV